MLQPDSCVRTAARACLLALATASLAGAAPVQKPLELGGAVPASGHYGDLLVYNPIRPGGPNYLCLYNPATPGGFDYIAGTWGPYWSIIPARLDGDDLTDVFLYNRLTGQWGWEINNGAGFTPGPSGTWSPSWELDVADFNGDGLDDLFVYNASSGAWYQCVNTGDTSAFEYFSGAPWPAGRRMLVGDFDGDGRLDVFAYDAGTGAWSQYLADPAGVFAPALTGSWSAGWQVFVASLDADGRDDIFVYNPDTGAWYQCFSTAGPEVFAYVGGWWSRDWQVVPADLDGDAVDDIFVYNAQSGFWYECLTNATKHGWRAYLAGQWSPGWTVKVTDFDGDGAADIFVYRPNAGDYYQCLNRGNGAFDYVYGRWDAGWSLASLIGDFLQSPPPPPPSVTAVSPSSGPTDGGTAITITGVNFEHGAQVFIGSAPALDVTVVSAQAITATTPPASAGARDVFVVNPDGQSGVLNAAFTYIPPGPPPPPPPTTPVLTTPDLLCFGDSITTGVTSLQASLLWSLSTIIEGYPPRLRSGLQATYPDQAITADQEGVPGEYATTQGQYRIASLLPGSNAQLVILLEGVNDLAAQVPYGTITEALRTMLRDAHDYGKKVILMTLPPVVPMAGTTVYKSATEAQVLALNERIRLLVDNENPAGTNDLVLVDMHAAFGPDPASLLSTDGLHPNAAGYQVMADTLRDAIVARYQVLK
jgi:lysophospholipase L1-like esterase